MADILQFPKKAEAPVEPRLSPVFRAIHGVLHKREPFADPERNENIKAGTHRFDIHPGQAACVDPQGFLINRAKDRKERMARNAAAIERYENLYVEVTDDGFVVREMG